MSMFLDLCGCALWYVSMGFTVYGTLLARQHFRKKPQQKTAPALSILKPFKGLEPRFSEAVESFFKIKYAGDFELLFCVSDEADPALAVVRAIAARYPDVDSRILVGQDANVPNPKAGNTYKAYALARYDLLLISDSNVIAPKNYLDDVTPLLADDVGIVTGIVAGVEVNTFAGFLEAATLNTFSARWMLIGSRAGAPIVMGKSMLFSRQEAERFGGLRTLGLYLAEDYMAGHAMAYLNKKVAIMHAPVRQIVSDYKFKTYWLRHVRWGRLRKAQSPLAFLAEPLIACLPIGILGSLSFSHVSGLPVRPLLLAHFGFWLINYMSLIINLRVQKGFHFLFGWFGMQFLYIPLWVTTMVGDTVQWRGRCWQLYQFSCRGDRHFGFNDRRRRDCWLIMDSFAAVDVLDMRRANGTAAAPSSLVNGDMIGRLNFSGYAASAYATNQAQVAAYATENWLSNSTTGTALAFVTTANGTTAPVERVRIDQNGNVGIGTTAPDEELNVIGNIHATGQIATGSQTITTGALDWNNGNAIMTSYDCSGTLSMANLRDGGTYNLIVTDTGSNQCSFATTTTGSGAGSIAYRFKPANATRSINSYTVYTFMRVGNTVLVSWASGF